MYIIFFFSDCWFRDALLHQILQYNADKNGVSFFLLRNITVVTMEIVSA